MISQAFLSNPSRETLTLDKPFRHKTPLFKHSMFMGKDVFLESSIKSYLSTTSRKTLILDEPLRYKSKLNLLSKSTMVMGKDVFLEFKSKLIAPKKSSESFIWIVLNSISYPFVWVLNKIKSCWNQAFLDDPMQMSKPLSNITTRRIPSSFNPPATRFVQPIEEPSQRHSTVRKQSAASSPETPDSLAKQVKQKVAQNTSTDKGNCCTLTIPKANEGKQKKHFFTTSPAFQQLLSQIGQGLKPKRLDLAGCSFDQDAFSIFVDTIAKQKIIKTLVFTKALLTSKQVTDLQVLVCRRKGLKVEDSEGNKFGPLYMNWHSYNEEKYNIISKGLGGMYPTTILALRYILQETGNLPNFVLDFGCSVGLDTLPLAEMGCKKIWAIDADEDALDKLKSNIRPGQHNRVTCINSPFMEVVVDEPVDLFISAYTWPLRKPEDFPACWDKCVSVTKIGGYIAGQFFGPFSKDPLDLDPCMTYHTGEEVRDLLAKNFSMVLFRKIPAGSSFEVSGGDKKPSWGDLFHVIAKRIR